MTYWVRLENNVGSEVISYNPEGFYPESTVWRVMPEEFEGFVGLPTLQWEGVGEDSVQPVLESAQEEMRLQTRTLRWEAESSPITHFDKVFSCAREHRQLMLEYITTAELTETLPPFKLLDGTWWTPASLEEIKSAYHAVIQKVATLFERERITVTAINAATTSSEALNAFLTEKPNFSLP